MALALGLGSLFNHSDSPNVSFSIDADTDSIRYTTSRAVLPDEELCIFYGDNLWFDPVDMKSIQYAIEKGPEHGWGSLSHLRDDVRNPTFETWQLVEGDPDEIIPEDKLPFVRIKTTPDDPEEEELFTIQTVEAWVVDVPDQRQIATMLRWLRTSGLEDSSVSHLKRIRKNQSSNISTLLLCLTSNSADPPALPNDMELPAPYVVRVPKLVALTQASLKLKSSLWPTNYAPKRKGEFEGWSRGKVRWAWEAMKTVLREATSIKRNGEHPIVAYVPEPYDEAIKEATQMQKAILAHDTRRTTSHPLRHATLNAIRAVADYRAATGDEETVPPLDNDSPSSNLTGVKEPEERRNGSHYLLTSLTVFLSHEPCIMCSMALLHSRVKEIIYITPMKKTGGCGSIACIPKLEGVNHRYGISRWKDGEGGISMEGLEVDEGEDA
ncbi:unnamed protein product [Somion occarium]